MKKITTKLRLSAEITLLRGSPRPEKSSIDYLSSFLLVHREKRRILPWAFNHLKWMSQKDVLSQDMLLVGPPGALRRRLAMACKLTEYW